MNLQIVKKLVSAVELFGSNVPATQAPELGDRNCPACKAPPPAEWCLANVELALSSSSAAEGETRDPLSCTTLGTPTEPELHRVYYEPVQETCE